MAKNDFMNVSATNEMQIDNNSTNRRKTIEGITARAENRLKRAFAEFGKAVAAFFDPIKKFAIMAIIIAAIVLGVLIILAAGYKYILKLDANKAEEIKTKILKGEEARLLMAQQLYGYKGQTSDLEEFAETVDFFLREDDQTFTRVATTSRAKKITTLDNFLFIGDSRYAGLLTSSLGNKIKNAGVSSSTIKEWIEVAKNKGQGTVQGQDINITGEYAGISIQLGANSVGNGVDNAVDEMKALINELKVLYPNTPIFVNSCVQVHPKANNNGYNWKPQTFRDNINEFNIKVETYCKTQSNIYYIDVNTNLNDSDGYLKSEYTGDGLHCNTEGVKVFANNIKNSITTLDVTGNNLQNNENQGTVSGGRTTETIKIEQNDDGEYCIVNKLDEKVNKIYESLKKDKNTLLKQFDNEKHAKESIKLWIIAEYSSQYVNLSSKVEDYKHDYNADYIQGIVKVKRYGIDDKGKETETYLTYKTVDDFNDLKSQYQNNGDTTVFNHFTIDAEDNLVIARYMKETQTSTWTKSEDTKQPIPAEDNYTRYTISEQKLNYRNMILPYTMPYFLFVTLTMYGEDADFANDMARLAIDSEMVIGVRDNVTTTVTTTVEKYSREEMTREYAKVEASALNETKESHGTFYKYLVNPVQTIVESRDAEKEFATNENNTKLVGIGEDPCYEKTTVNTMVSNYVAMGIEYIDGWCFNHKIEYETKGEDTSTEETNEIQNTEYEIVKAYSDGLIKDLKIANIENSNENLETVYKEAVDKIKAAKSNDILREYYNRNLSYINQYANNNNAYKVLSQCGIVDLLIKGKSPNYNEMNQEYLNSIGIEVESEDEAKKVRESVRTEYDAIFSKYGTQDAKTKIIDNAITKKIVEFGTEQKERIVNRSITTKTHTITKVYNKTLTQTIEKTSKNPEAGEENFVSILCNPEYRNVKYQLTGSTASWFFETLESEQETAGMIELMKYLFYKTTNKDYGVTEFDFSKGLTIIDTSNFHSMGVLVGDSVQAKIWFGLKSIGYSDLQIAAAMGNFEHEAGFKTTNIENAAEYKYGGDQAFTDGVNSGNITRDAFVNGTYTNSKGKNCIYGYGLAQWTAANRKAGLYDFAKSKGVGIDDVDIQIEYLLAEITGVGAEGYATRSIDESTVTTYTGKTYAAKDWYSATSDELDINTLNDITLAFCYTFERPAVSASSERSRQEAALKYYNEFHGKTLAGGQYSESSLDFVQGQFTSGITGKTFLVYDQTVLFNKYRCGNNGGTVNNWCNHYTAACIASGYRGSASEMSLIDATRSTSNLLSVYNATNNYLAPYGLEVESINDQYLYSMDTMKSLLKERKYIAIYFIGETFGKSGSKYSRSGSAHWVAVLGYRIENGEEQIYIGNSVSSWGNGWRSLDEFERCQSQIKYFTVIKEK